MDGEAVMVCVTQQYECERLIREGKRISDAQGGDFYVINVQPKQSIGKKMGHEIEYLFSVSKELRAQMLVFFAEDPVMVISNCIKRYNIKNLVLGSPAKGDLQIIENIRANALNVKIHIAN